MSIAVRIRIGAFSNKPCLLFKEAFYITNKPHLEVNKPCLETGLFVVSVNHLFLADLQNLVSLFLQSLCPTDSDVFAYSQSRSIGSSTTFVYL